MDAEVYMIRCGTREACQRAAERLCRLLGAEQTMRPNDSTGRGWVARVVVHDPAADEPAAGQ